VNPLKLVVRAAFVAPMDAPVIHDGAVVTADGFITDVGPATRILKDHADATVDEMGEALLLPGLVNAHAHLELTLVDSPRAWDAPFIDWLLAVRGRAQPELVERVYSRGVVNGVGQCLSSGVTCLGDICQHTSAARRVLFGLVRRPRVVSFAEVIGLGRRRSRFDELFGAAMRDESPDDSGFRRGISPHAPYSVDRLGYEACLSAARARSIPIATHLAETPHEREFLEWHAGPFRELLDRIGSFEEPIDTFRGPPIAFAQAIGLLDYPTLLAHVNYCDDDELRTLARGRASVVYCPRTHAYFGHPPHRWREMLAAGINVAVGTDSCASSPNLNLVDDLRLLHRIAPEVPSCTLWHMATIRGARALQWDVELGSLSVGKRADMVGFPLGGSTIDPLADILESDVRPTRVWIGGA
jgi:aminodeoxyfutalosine deaminase